MDTEDISGRSKTTLFYSPCIKSGRHVDDASLIIIRECFDNIFFTFIFVQGEDVKTTLVVGNLAKDRAFKCGKTRERELSLIHI